MNVEVVIPFRGGCPHREAALRWVLNRYEPPVTIAEGPPGPWRKGAAVNPAVEASSADIIAIADADVWCEGLTDAVGEVEAGAPWAVPHEHVHRLSRGGTASVLEGEAWRDQSLDQRAYRGLIGGGIVVAPREVLLSVPLDPRFEGWGQEDEAQAIALTQLFGNPWRGIAPLVHLWHPPQDRLCRKRGSVEGWQLRRRYLKARQDPIALRALIEEFRDTRQAGQPPMHDYPSDCL